MTAGPGGPGPTGTGTPPGPARRVEHGCRPGAAAVAVPGEPSPAESCDTRRDPSKVEVPCHSDNGPGSTGSAREPDLEEDFIIIEIDCTQTRAHLDGDGSSLSSKGRLDEARRTLHPWDSALDLRAVHHTASLETEG